MPIFICTDYASLLVKQNQRKILSESTTWSPQDELLSPLLQKTTEMVLSDQCLYCFCFVQVHSLWWCVLVFPLFSVFLRYLFCCSKENQLLTFLENRFHESIWDRDNKAQITSTSTLLLLWVTMYLDTRFKPNSLQWFSNNSWVCRFVNL